MKNIENKITEYQTGSEANTMSNQESFDSPPAGSKIIERRFIRKNLLPELRRYVSRSGRAQALTVKNRGEL
ncbi:hypothetical protein MNBD_NITROSPINAE02-509 [hydrothermal vent metagenome]|uniref:Uncharacterized protein n=1 Tax=hydrothermal vent metagenome TaxID=652676 RepID=A0A3B1CAV8_9ZZZZ